jgi:type VI secretion system secreted protein VgrG
MEVIISFVDGDPDRPLVTGCVYNGENATPGLLPFQATKSIIRTRTIPHGQGHNEISFEDARGMERVHIRAQRDLDELVLQDHLTNVGRSQANRVTVDQVEEVGRDQQLHVHGDRTMTISGLHAEHCSSDRLTTINGSERISVGDDYLVEVEGGTYQVEVGEGECVLRSRGPIVLEQDDTRFIELSSDGDAPGITLQSDESTVRIKANEIELTVGASTVQTTPTMIRINGKIFPTQAEV